jgi:peptide/nickel transport system substrate-binding protein
MKKNIAWPIVCIVTILVMLLAGCGAETTEKTTGTTTTITSTTATEPTTTTTTPTTTTTTSEPRYGGTLKLAQYSMWNSWMPGDAGTGQVAQFSYVYETLAEGDWAKGPAGTNEINFQGSISPAFRKGSLAKSWEWIEPSKSTIPVDKTVVACLVIHLKEGILFQDRLPVNGREMTADDWVASYKFFRDTAVQKNTVLRDYAKGITALDKYTVQIDFSKRVVDMEGYLYSSNTAIILPKEMLAAPYLSQLVKYQYAIGTGPFVVTDAVADSSMTFKKNPSYWGYDELNPKNRLPYIEGITVLNIADSATRLAALRTGKVDIISGLTMNETSEVEKSNPKIIVSSGTANRLDMAVSMRMDIPPFNDINVRKAMVMAIDYPSIIKDYLKGYGTVPAFPCIPNWKDVYTPLDKCPADIQELFGYHPDKARQLLIDAGYSKGLQIEVMNYRPDLIDKLQLFIDYWQKVGVTATIKSVDVGTWAAAVAGTTYTGATVAGAGTVDPETSLLTYIPSGNWPWYDEKRQALAVTFDNAERTQLMKEMNVWIMQNWIFPYWPIEYVSTVWQPWIKNFHGETGMGRSTLGWGASTPGWLGPIARHIWIDESLKK